MQMQRRALTLVVVSVALIATIVLVSAGLSHAQSMMGNRSFIESTFGHMNQMNHDICIKNMTTQVNATENMPAERMEFHGSMNMTRHMMGMGHMMGSRCPHR